MKQKRKRYLSIDGFRQLVTKGEVAPTYLFAGQESFIAEEALHFLRDNLIPEEERGFNYDVLYGGDVQAQEIITLALSYPMMGNYRLVVVKEFDKVTKPDTLTGYIKNPLESTVLVLVSESPDFRKNPYRIFYENNILDCSPLYDNQIPQWITQRVRRLKKKIQPEAAEALAGYAGNSLQQIVNELEKIDVFTGSRTTIEVEDVNAVVGVSKRYNIFELWRAVGNKKSGEAVNILERMLETGESPVYIVVMLTRFFLSLLKLSDLKSKRLSSDEIARASGVNRYFLNEYYEYLNHHPAKVLTQRFQALLEADTILKTTGTHPRIVLSMLLYRLMDKGEKELVLLDAFDKPLEQEG